MKLFASSNVLWTALLVVIKMRSCQSEVLTSNLQECATQEQATEVEDFFPDKTYPAYSKTWGVSYHNTYKILTNKAVNETYLLYQCGTVPPEEEISSGKHKVVTSVPLPDGVALTSTVQIPMFELLGLRSEIKSYIGDNQYISSPCLVEGIDDGVVEVSEGNMDVEDMFQEGNLGTVKWVLEWESKYPDRIIIDNQFMSVTGQGTDKTMIEYASAEGSSKSIFEWLSFYAIMYNKEREAEELIQETSARYDCTTQNAISKNILTDEVKPVAVWAYFSNYPGWEGWRVGKCDPKFNYYCEYMRDCSIDLLHSNKTMDDGEFEEFAKDADLFFYSYKDFDEMYEKKKDILDNFKSVANKQVYDYLGSGESVWHEQRKAEYDVVLEDICTIANRTTDLAPHTPLYFRNVFTENAGEHTFDGCVDYNSPLVSRATECTILNSDASSSGKDVEDDSSASLKSNYYIVITSLLSTLPLLFI